MQYCCGVCGGSTFVRKAVLWKGLIDEWQLSPDEVDYIDRQQGECCTGCNSNLRSIALANALRWALKTELALLQFCAGQSASRVLELNEAGNLHSVLSRLPRHTFGYHPQIDIHRLPYADESFDVVVHSDTLEHVAQPIHALKECHCALAKGGALCFTVPIIVGRMSRSRDGLTKSYHGNPNSPADDMLVRTEFGADAWTYPLKAGFSSVHVFSVGYPAGIAMAAVRS